MPFFIRKKGKPQQLQKKLSERVGADGGEGRTTRSRAGASMTTKGRRKETQNQSKKHHDDDEITSEEDEELDEQFEQDEDDPVEEETPQQTRIRLAKEQISEAKKTLKRQRTEDDDESDDAGVIGKLLKENEMVEEGRALSKVMPDGYESMELGFKVVLSGGKVMKSPLTSISTATIGSNTIVYASTKSGHVISCNLATGKKTHVLLSSLSSPSAVTCVCASSRFVAACTPEQISVIDPETLRVVKGLSGSRGAVWMCLDSGDGSTLYSCHRDRTVKVWDLEEGAYVESLFGHQDVPTWVDSSGKSSALQNGKSSARLVVSTGGFDRSIRVWKVNEESHLVYNCWEGEDILDVVKVLGGGLFVVGGGCSGSIGLYCFGRKRVLDVVEHAHGMGPGSVPKAITALGGHGDFVASGSDNGIVKVWRVSEVGRRRTIKFVRDVCFERVGGVVIGIDVCGGDSLSMVVGLGTEMRNGRWGGRVCNVSRVVSVTC